MIPPLVRGATFRDNQWTVIFNGTVFPMIPPLVRGATSNVFAAFFKRVEFPMIPPLVRGATHYPA